MPTQYSITLEMTDATIESLANASVSLCALKAVASSSSGFPTVWFTTVNYDQTNTITWSEQYGVFTAEEFSIPNGVLDVRGQNNSNLSNNWEIDNGNTGELISVSTTSVQPTPMAIGIYNNTKKSAQPAIWSAGICQQVNGVMQPIYSCNLLPGFEVLMKPIEKVMLYFDTRKVQTGSVVSQAFSDALMIDFSDSTSQTVSYDALLGWSQNNGAAFQVVEAPDLVDELISQF